MIPFTGERVFLVAPGGSKTATCKVKDRGNAPEGNYAYTIVLDNVALGLLYTGGPLRQRRAAARVALGRVGLGHRLTHRPPMLSGGERQRVAIARAIAKRPRLILADEPTGNLDSKASAEVVALLHGLASDGATLVLITHDENIARGFDRRIQMRDGEIVSDERQ